MRTFIFIILFDLVACLHAYSSEPIAYAGKSNALHISTDQLEILEDKEGRLSIQDVLLPATQQKFKKISSGAGSFDQLYWLKFQVKKDLADKAPEILELEFPQAEDVSLFFFENDSVIVKQQSGISFPYASREIKGSSPLFHLSVSSPVLYCYMRIRAPYLKFPLIIYSAEDYREHNQWQLIFSSVLYGIFTIVLVITLLLFFFLRQKVYMYYGVFVLSVILILSCENGLIYRFLNEDASWWNKRFFVLFANLNMLSIIILSFHLLRLKMYKTNLNLFGYACLAACSILIIAALIFSPGHVLLFTTLCKIPVSLWLVFSGMLVYSKNRNTALFFLFGVGVFISKQLADITNIWSNSASGINYLSMSMDVLEIICLAFSLGFWAKENIESAILKQFQDKKAIHPFHIGKIELPDKIPEHPIELKDLTKRETEVLGWIIKGLTDKDIAQQMEVSIPTVKSHSQKIYSKLKLKNRTEAAVKYRSYY